MAIFQQRLKTFFPALLSGPNSMTLRSNLLHTVDLAVLTLVISCTVSEIHVRWLIGRKIAKIARSYPPQSHKSPLLGWPLFRRVIPCQKVKWWGYQTLEKSSFRFDTIPAVTDKRTDRQTDRHVAVANTRATHNVARVKISRIDRRPIWEIFKWRYLCKGSFDPLHVWF